VNFVESAAVDRFQEIVRRAYRERFAIDPLFYKVNPSDGASRIS
jgi:hypothetical protein